MELDRGRHMDRFLDSADSFLRQFNPDIEIQAGIVGLTIKDEISKLSGVSTEERLDEARREVKRLSMMCSPTTVETEKANLIPQL
jgi:hypothetical protein